MKMVVVWVMMALALTACDTKMEGKITRRFEQPAECIQRGQGQVCIAYGRSPRYVVCVDGRCAEVTKPQYDRCTVGKEYPACRVSER